MSLAELDEMIAQLRALDGDRLAERIAARAAPLIDAAVKATASRGQSPDGTPWPKRQDGGAPLEHAADHISTKAAGSVVRMTLTGPDVFHHFGATRGSVRRQVIPDAGAAMPPVVERTLVQAAREELDAATGDRR